MKIADTIDANPTGPDARITDRPAFEASLKGLRNDHRNVALPTLFFVYGSIAGIFALSAFWAPWYFTLVIAVPMGLLQYRVVISGHEAVHHTLVWPRWLNEFLGVFGQALVGVNFASYRVQHLEHHKARDVDGDPDGHIYGPIVATERGLRRWLIYTLGTFVEIAIKIVQKGVGSVGTKAVERSEVNTRPSSALHTVYVLGAQGTLFLLAWASTGRFTGYFELWIVPLFLVTVFLNRSRILVEHGLPMLIEDFEQGRGLKTVDIVPPTLERLIFAPFLFNYHCCHHLYMTVPHYNLPALRALLLKHRVPGFYEVRGTYVSVILRLMRA